MSKELVILTEEQRKAVEKELSAGNNVEIVSCDKGVIIRRVKREVVKLNK